MAALFAWMAPAAWAQGQVDDDGNAANPLFEAELKDGDFIPLTGGGGGTCSNPVTINFEGYGLSEGDFVNTQIPGVTISTESSLKAMIFDSACPGGCSGDDPDLKTPGYGSGNNTARGQILIISEDNDQSDPDDNASGGTLVFDFNSLVDLIDVGMLDMDDGSPSATLKAYRNGTQIGSQQTVGAQGDNSYQTVSFARPQVNRLRVILNSSGAVPTVKYCPTPPFNGTCFVVADSQNELLRVDLSNAAEQSVGNTGVGNVEAIALSPDGNTLYAANAGTFGTLSTSTGSFSSIGSFGTAGGSEGNISLSDVDGLAFDPTTGILYGSHRRSGDDVLFQINISTGAHVPNAFGPGIDYVVVPGIGSRHNIDDLAIHPTNGTMYATLNDSGEDDLLITINKTTGASSSVGSIGVDDMEGLTFLSNGSLYGTTGNENGNSTDDKLWSISLGGSASLIGALSKGDYEAIACPTGGTTGTADLQCLPGTGPDNEHGYTNLTTGQVCDPANLAACDEAEAGHVLLYEIPFESKAVSTINATGVTLRLYYPGDADTDGDVDLNFIIGRCNPSALCTTIANTNPSGAQFGYVDYTVPSLSPGQQVTVEVELQVGPSPPASRLVSALFAEVAAMTQPDPNSTPGNLGNPPVFNNEDDECALVAVLPVELVAFEAVLDGQGASLQWETASETNNAGFDVQHRYKDEADKTSAVFESLGFVEGFGTTLEAQHYTFRVDDLAPGRHVFRLKQLDYDGTFSYSPEVEVSVGMPESFLVSKVYPNPFNPEASMSFGVKQEQAVRVELFNMLGQRVKVLYQGRPAAGTTKTLSIDGSDLRSGMYIVRVQGERFVDTQMITLVK